MRTQLKEVSGVDWFDAAMMNCLWEGPRLSDILSRAGVDSQSQSEKNGDAQQKHSASQMHVQFACYGAKQQEDDWYGGSIPLERAMDPEMDVILAVKVRYKSCIDLTCMRFCWILVRLRGISAEVESSWLASFDETFIILNDCPPILCYLSVPLLLMFNHSNVWI